MSLQSKPNADNRQTDRCWMYLLYVHTTLALLHPTPLGATRSPYIIRVDWLQYVNVSMSHAIGEEGGGMGGEEGRGGARAMANGAFNILHRLTAVLRNFNGRILNGPFYRGNRHFFRDLREGGGRGRGWGDRRTHWTGTDGNLTVERLDLYQLYCFWLCPFRKFWSVMWHLKLLPSGYCIRI